MPPPRDQEPGSHHLSGWGAVGDPGLVLAKISKKSPKIGLMAQGTTTKGLIIMGPKSGPSLCFLAPSAGFFWNFRNF